MMLTTIACCPLLRLRPTHLLDIWIIAPEIKEKQELRVARIALPVRLAQGAPLFFGRPCRLRLRRAAAPSGNLAVSGKRLHGWEPGLR